MNERQDDWYKRRLMLRIAIYAFGGIAAVLSAVLYSSATFSGDFLVRVFIAVPFILSVFEDEELSWGNKLWRTAKLPFAAFGLLLVAYLILPSPTSLAVAIAVVLLPYFGFACFSASQSIKNISGFRSMFELREIARRKKQS